MFAVLFAASALALVLFLFVSTARLLNQQVEASIRADARSLSERWREGGPVPLLEAIRDRLTENPDRDAIYLLTDAAGQRLAGNLRAWPAGVDEPAAWYELPIQRGGVQTLARVQRFDLPGGLRLLIGRDVQTRAAVRDLLGRTLLWTLGLAVLLGIAGALAIQRLIGRMLAGVADTAAAIQAGDVSRRVRVRGRGDEIDRLAETVNAMLDRMGRLMDGVRQVSNSIAHDLRTPITRARARLEDASSHAADVAGLRTAVDRAVVDLDGVVDVFRALLRIAEIEAGGSRSGFAPVDVTPLLADLAELYGATAEERGLTLDAAELAGLPTLMLQGDRTLVQQAVANLLDNAIKFCRPGGTVRVQAEADPATVRIVVADEGPGIPPADRARVTERFFRGESARSTPGAGLGLALVHAVAQLHGGRLVLADAGLGNPPGLRATLELARGPG